MRFETDINTQTLPTILSDFVAIIGWNAWKNRQHELQRQLHENSLLKHYFIERHSLELALFDLVSYRRSHGRLPRKIRSRQEYQLCSFMWMVNGFYQRLTTAGRDRLVGRLRDGLQSENSFAALRHEMNVAAHFLRNQYDVEPRDLEYGGGIDFFVRKEDVVAEVECKMASADIGRMIHQRHMIQLSHKLQPVLVAATSRLHGGRIITIELPNRLTGNAEQHQRISTDLATVLTGGSPASSSENLRIQTTTFDLATSPFWDVVEPTVTDEAIQSFVAQRIGEGNAHAFVYGIPRKSSFVVVIRSAKPDKVAKGIYEQLKRATKSQFSGTQNGVLAVEISDISPTQLKELARSQRDGVNALQAIASRLFNNPTRIFLHTVAFVSAGGAQQSTIARGNRISNIVTDDGPCYTFRNSNNAMGSQPELKFFNSSPLFVV